MVSWGTQGNSSNAGDGMDMAEQISFYSKSDCPLCDTGLVKLVPLADKLGLEIVKIDIESDPDLLERYCWRIPVAVLRQEELGWGRLSSGALERRLGEVLASSGSPKTSPGSQKET